MNGWDGMTFGISPMTRHFGEAHEDGKTFSRRGPPSWFFGKERCRFHGDGFVGYLWAYMSCFEGMIGEYRGISLGNYYKNCGICINGISLVYVFCRSF